MTFSYWWLFLLVLFLAGVLLNIHPLSALAIMLAVVSSLARLWQRRSLEAVSYRRRLIYRRGFSGEKVPVRLEVENRKFLPISWLRVKDPWPVPVAPEDDSVLTPTENSEMGLMINLFSLRWFERSAHAYQILFRKRGVYPLGPAVLESGDLFGLFEKTRQEEAVEYLTVFPSPAPFNELQLPADDPFGDRRARRRLYEDPTLPMGVRDYHPEDDFRRVHWPATAHTGEVQVKVYQPTSARVLVVCLNVATNVHQWEGINQPLLERLISVSTTLVQQAIQDGYQVGLISNGCLAHSDQPFRVPPGRSPQQMSQLLEALARVTPFLIWPFERFLLKEVPRLPYGATLLIVTGVTTSEFAETLLRLKQHSRRMTLLSFSHRLPPDIPGVRAIHLPFRER